MTTRRPLKFLPLLLFVLCSFTTNLRSYDLLGLLSPEALEVIKKFNDNIVGVKNTGDAWNKTAQDYLLKFAEGMKNIDPEIITEIKNALKLLSDAKNGGAENAVFSLLDNSTNIIALKAIGILTTGFGLATLYQWLGSLENGKKPIWVRWLQKVIAPTPQHGTEKQPAQVAEEGLDTEKEGTDVDDELADDNELTDDAELENEAEEDCAQTASRRARFGRFMCKIIPPTIGTIFVLAGLTCVLKARAISAFVVGHGSKSS